MGCGSSESVQAWIQFGPLQGKGVSYRRLLLINLPLHVDSIAQIIGLADLDAVS